MKPPSCNDNVIVGSNGKFFIWTIFNHLITECFISCESVMDSLEKLFLASFLQLISAMVFLVSQLFTISMSMKSSFLEDVLRKLKEGPSYT